MGCITRFRVVNDLLLHNFVIFGHRLVNLLNWNTIRYRWVWVFCRLGLSFCLAIWRRLIQYLLWRCVDNPGDRNNTLWTWIFCCQILYSGTIASDFLRGRWDTLHLRRRYWWVFSFPWRFDWSCWDRSRSVKLRIYWTVSFGWRVFPTVCVRPSDLFLYYIAVPFYCKLMFILSIWFPFLCGYGMNNLV